MFCWKLFLKSQVTMCLRILQEIPPSPGKLDEDISVSPLSCDYKLPLLRRKNQQVWKWLQKGWMSHSVPEQRSLLMTAPIAIIHERILPSTNAEWSWIPPGKTMSFFVRCFPWNGVNLTVLLLQNYTLDWPPPPMKGNNEHKKMEDGIVGKREKEKHRFTNARCGV